MLQIFYCSSALADYVTGTTDEDSGDQLIAPVLPKPNEQHEPWDPFPWNIGPANEAGTLRRWSAPFSEITKAAIDAFCANPPVEGQPCGYLECETVAEANTLIPGWES
jgi:hypothetical protein